MPAETRGAFRVYPSRENPVYLKVNNTNLTAVDISAGGISFENKSFKKNVSYDMQITLPATDNEINAKVEILKIDEGNICRAKMVDLSPQDEDDIHHYILTRQKEELIEKKYK
ncbi:MAG: PilZ domain-containing protein [Candidatus Nitrohelix vancouverensis]|uniref:PilZ domain-containing protein n=1 Tax=Candidatus Nitrohelix vancouverensis TaxID=2705534 RepID=A0A7T0C3Z4_9BACT|nr:MAG: PilZ domain-containing protein [Candidatus Nitrohelix vancouverensis]